MQAQQIAPAAVRWLETSTAVSILHIFDHACNLVNERGEVLSLIAPSLGAGPFAVVVGKNSNEFHELTRKFVKIRENSLPIAFSTDAITFPDVQIDLKTAVYWQPIPPWTAVSSELWQAIAAAYPAPPDAFRPPPVRYPAFCPLPIALITGLGAGLTPAGDDYLMGALYALWAMGRADARVMATVVETAVNQTTTLSLAWLRAAARGEASMPWHLLVQAALAGDGDGVETAVFRILATGASSGAAAWAGFTDGLLLSPKPDAGVDDFCLQTAV